MEYRPASATTTSKLAPASGACYALWVVSTHTQDPVSPSERASPSKPFADCSPNELLAAVAEKRDQRAFAALFDRFAPKVKAYALRRGADQARADELVQDVMLTLWRKADAFDLSRAQASTWLFTIARNRWIDHIRQEQRPALDPNDPMFVGEPEPAADQRLVDEGAARDLRAAIKTLPEEQASLIHTSYFEDLSQRDIARTTGVPLGTVKSRIRLAMAHLFRELGDPE
jgi:RNA polymerase sigma-70 factor (ECF subfamily)